MIPWGGTYYPYGTPEETQAETLNNLPKVTVPGVEPCCHSQWSCHHLTNPRNPPINASQDDVFQSKLQSTIHFPLNIQYSTRVQYVSSGVKLTYNKMHKSWVHVSLVLTNALNLCIQPPHQDLKHSHHLKKFSPAPSHHRCFPPLKISFVQNRFLKLR